VDENLELLRLMRHCGHFIRHRSIIKQSQNKILFLLYKNGPMSQKELMKKMRIKAGSLSEVVSKVEANGYIEKRRASDDKRNFELSLTDKGKAQAELFEEQQSEMARSLFEPLDQKQKQELRAIMSKLLENWEGLPPTNN
jgi:DNA-binding MarR family transcriptional regulator